MMYQLVSSPSISMLTETGLKTGFTFAATMFGAIFGFAFVRINLSLSIPATYEADLFRLDF